MVDLQALKKKLAICNMKKVSELAGVNYDYIKDIASGKVDNPKILDCARIAYVLETGEKFVAEVEQ